MAGDATLVLEISPTATNGLPENLDAGQARAALALMAQLHLCYEARQLAQCVAEHLAGLIQADSWRLNFTPAAVRAAFSQETSPAETAENGESDAWPGLSTAPWPGALRASWPLIQTSVQRRQTPEGCALSVSLVVYGQTLGQALRDRRSVASHDMDTWRILRRRYRRRSPVRRVETRAGGGHRDHAELSAGSVRLARTSRAC